jgi:hypothetical protein
VLATSPREILIGRTAGDLARLLAALDEGTAADLGRALGYSEADIRAWYERTGLIEEGAQLEPDEEPQEIRRL